MFIWDFGGSGRREDIKEREEIVIFSFYFHVLIKQNRMERRVDILSSIWLQIWSLSLKKEKISCKLKSERDN
jgi:hypothetical protein